MTINHASTQRRVQPGLVKEEDEKVKDQEITEDADYARDHVKDQQKDCLEDAQAMKLLKSLRLTRTGMRRARTHERNLPSNMRIRMKEPGEKTVEKHVNERVHVSA